MDIENLEGLPGNELVTKGLEDLSAGRHTVEACLVAIGAPRLRDLGFEVPQVVLHEHGPEHALYFLLAEEDPDTAHSRYNALVRRLVSFERALEAEWGREYRRSRQ